MNEILFDDQITLLKPLGYNLVTFYHKNLKTLVIFHPALKTIVKSFKVKDLNDYQFRDDRKYFFTIEYDDFYIYKIQDDSYFLLDDHIIQPIGFQQNYLLCMKDLGWEDSSYEDYYRNPYCDDDSDENSKEFDEDLLSESTFYTMIQLSLITIEGSQIQSKISIKEPSQNKLSILDKFYIILQEDNKGSQHCQYYQVMINNKPSIKFYVFCDTIFSNNQLKHSNFYLTRISNYKDYLLIMTKQSKTCKIIRKIKLQGYYNRDKLIFNYRQVLQIINPKQKIQVQLINLWNLQKYNTTVDSYEEIILTKNNNMIVLSQNNCLKIIKM
ncbi:hypothetical protein pb186bvf_017481 [Paramecium bursaria]